VKVPELFCETSEPVTDLHPPEWNAVLARLGLASNPPAAKTDAGRRVDRLVPRFNARTSDAEIALSLLTAAASGPLRERLLATQARSTPHHHGGRGHTPRPQPAARRGAIVRALARFGVTTGQAAASPERERPDARLWRETAAAIAAASPPELDRDAAIDGLRQLYEKGRLSGERVEAILRRLGGHE
jgi:hypothetical protein